MKKIILPLLIIAIAFTSFFIINHKDENNITEQNITDNTTPAIDISEIKFSTEKRTFNKENINKSCDSEHRLNCLIDTFARCAIDSHLSVCKETKLPRFVFLEDENLARPTEVSYSISSIFAIDATTIEVQTTATCNGKFFGLCNGEIIYMISISDNFWYIKDLYAIE